MTFVRYRTCTWEFSLYISTDFFWNTICCPLGLCWMLLNSKWRIRNHSFWDMKVHLLEFQVSKVLVSMKAWLLPLISPCSLVLGIFPQGLVAVTVGVQVASMSARFRTPVLFFIPVTRSHSPQALKSYLHSPKRTQNLHYMLEFIKGQNQIKTKQENPTEMSQQAWVCQGSPLSPGIDDL